MRDIARWIVLTGVFALPFISLYVASTLFFPYITGKNFTFRIIVEIILAAWIILALYDADYRPRFSWILVGFTAFVVVMFFANLFGEYPPKSFWSNYERMEGYVTLIHLFAYFVVAASVLNTEKLWDRFLMTSVVAALLLSFNAFGQIAGFVEHRYEGFRADATLGNASYMAVYMLFHTFISLFLLARAKTRGWRIAYAVCAALFVFMLIQTATRGTTLALVGGGLLTTLYIGLFARSYPQMRKIAIGSLVAIAIIVLGFIAIKDTSLIQDNMILSRIASVSLEAGSTRFTIWGMALEGVKERPLLGWGQGNFNYVFNEKYKPSLYGQEPWFDRVHNIFMDWLIAGGVLGFLTYFSILGAALYYVIVRPMLVKDDETFTVAERGVLLGLFGAYVFHNIFVFDNIISYIFYASVLALIHSRVSTEIPSLFKAHVDERVITQVAAPVVGVALAFTLYYVNVPGILAAHDIIDAFRQPTPEARLEAFERALTRGSFADQEIIEQLTRQTQQIVRDQRVAAATREELRTLTETELLKLAEEKRGDARVEVFISSFYRQIGEPQKALEHLEIARSLSPQKQQILFELGLAHIQANQHEAAKEVLREAYELATENRNARVMYAVAALYTKDIELVHELITPEYEELYAKDEMVLGAAYATKLYDEATKILKKRIELQPNNLQHRVSLAAVYQESGQPEEAIATLREAVDLFPEFKEQGEGFIDDLKQGRVPGQQQTPIVEVGGEEVEVQSE